MKRLFTLSIALVAYAIAIGQVRTEWSTHKTVEVNKHPSRTEFISYHNIETAFEDDYLKSTNVIDLNGTWSFSFFKSHKDPQINRMLKAGNDFSSWGTITVPGSWELQGYGDARYTNHPYDFMPVNPTPPALPENFEAGIYKKYVDVPPLWMDKDIFFVIGAAKGGVYLYINGQEVGYNEDAKTAAEFNVTKYLHAGMVNEIAIVIYRYSSGSYLECQDFFRLTGIHRNTYIMAQPKTRINDFGLTATMDENYKDGRLDLSIEVSNSYNTPQTFSVGFDIYDKAGELVTYNSRQVTVPANSAEKVDFTNYIIDAKEWSAEVPNLYTLLFRVRKDARYLEYFTFDFGFRNIEIKNNQVLVNDKPILIKGVNYHEHNPYTGHYVDEQTLRKDLSLMKEHGINAIRTSHYPQQSLFYELCNEYGFYICDEANIESHGMGYNLEKGRTLGNNPEWFEAHMSRTRNMYMSNRNYSSIIFWSLGNEAGNGYNFYKTYQYLKDVDAIRPVQYERALKEWNTDIFCPQYPSTQRMEQWGKSETDRPYIASEYSHSMGNSTGNLKDWWDMVYKYPNLQGGFIWDWVDQAIWVDKDGGYFAYGGDFGVNQPSDGNFVCNGIVNADRSEQPALQEVQRVYQAVRFENENIDKGMIRVVNNNFWDDLSEYQVTYEIYREGKIEPLATGFMKTPIAPQSSKVFQIPVRVYVPDGDKFDYYVKLLLKTKSDIYGMKKGTVVASGQIQVPVIRKKFNYLPKGASLRATKTKSSLILNNGNVVVHFNNQSGEMLSYKVGGVEYIKDLFGLRPNFWRAPVDNDYGSGAPHKLQSWKIASEKQNGYLTYKATSNSVTVTVDYNDLPNGSKMSVAYRVFNSGVINVSTQYNGAGDTEPSLPRLGMRLRVDKSMNWIKYFGRGPQENYIDRNYGTDKGTYISSVANQYFPYVFPQENGHHTETSWLAVGKGESGKNGLLFISDDKNFEFNVLNNSIEDFDSQESDKDYQWRNISTETKDPTEAKNKLRKQTHINDIKPQDFTEICIDYRMQGVAGDNSWGARPYEKYRIPANGTYEYKFTIVPILSFEDIKNYSNIKY